MSYRAYPVAGRLAILLLLLLLLLLRAAVVSSEPALWLVTDQQGRGQAYLFGSVHYGSEGLYPLPNSVLSAFDSSDELVVELDSSRLNDARVRELFRQLGYFSHGRPLDERIPAVDRDMLYATLSSLGAPVEPLLRMKPWLLAMYLNVQSIEQAGYSRDLGLDEFFLRRARSAENSKRVVELESLRQQLSVFDSLTTTQQLEMLRSTLHYRGEVGAMLQRLTAAWSGGDEVDLEMQLLLQFQNDAAILDLLLYQRNRAMAERLVGYLEDGRRLFVVVGASHLLGDEGLPELLRSRGYHLSRVTGVDRGWAMTGG